MLALSVITGPPLIAGILEGLNRREAKTFKQDPWAAYKLISITSTFAFAKVVSQIEVPKSTPKQIITSGLLGAPLVCGSMYCIGLLLTKIPEKETF